MSKRKSAPAEEQPIDGPDAEALAARIRQERLYLGLSQADVATALDIPRAAVSALETGRRRVSGLELKGLAQLFGTSVDRLLGEVAPRGPRHGGTVSRDEGPVGRQQEPSPPVRRVPSHGRHRTTRDNARGCVGVSIQRAMNLPGGLSSTGREPTW